MPEHHPPTNPGYETTDIHTPPVWRFLLYLFLITFVSIGLMYGMFYVLKGHNEAQDPAPTAMEQQRSLPIGTRLQVNEPQDLKTYRANQEKATTSYGWENKPVKVVRIPVARAMEIVAERGLPKFEVPAAMPAAKPATPAREAK